MIDLKLPTETKAVLAQKAKGLREEYRRKHQQIQTLQSELNELKEAIISLESISGDNGSHQPASAPTQTTLRPTVNFNKLTLGEAFYRILKSESREMTAKQIVETLRQAGRDFSSPNARDIVTMYLRNMTDKVEIRKEGRTNYYKAK